MNSIYTAEQVKAFEKSSFVNKGDDLLAMMEAANNSVDEICQMIGAKTLKFLDIHGLYKAMGFEKRNELYPQLTDHHFTGDYPVKIIDELGQIK